MCDPFTILSAVLGVGSALFGATAKPPPAPELPAAPVQNTKAPGATVRIGTGAESNNTDDPSKSSAIKKPMTPEKSQKLDANKKKIKSDDPEITNAEVPEDFHDENYEKKRH